MGSVRLPQAQLSEITPPKKRDPQAELIMQVLGNNPLAQGINQAAPQITNALAQRAQMRRDMQQQARAFDQQKELLGIKNQYELQQIAAKESNKEKDQSTGYVTPRGIDVKSGRPVYSNSKKVGLFYDDGSQFKDQPGKLNLQALPEAQIEKESSLATLKFALDKIKSSYEPKYVGPIDSRLGKAKQYSNLTADSKAADFYSNVADLRNQIVYLRSGKQINEEEYKRLLNALPNEGLSDTDFSQRLTNTVKMIDQITTSRQGALEGSGFRKSNKSQETGDQRKARLLQELLGAK